MDIKYQDLDWVISKTQKLFTKNPHKSLSATFRFFRQHTTLSFIGDYPLLSAIVVTVITIGIKFSQYSLIYAFNQSEELKTLGPKEKSPLLGCLINPTHVQTKPAFLASHKKENKQNDSNLITSSIN